jgi:TonB-dependent receptor
MSLFFRSFSILFFLIFSGFVVAQTSTIKGTVIDGSTGESLPGASVSISGTAVGTVTDINGKFTISNVNPGVYSLTVRFISFETKVIKDVKVEAGKPTILEVTVSPAANELGEVVIEATMKRESVNAMLAIQKNSVSVSDGISAEAIRKTPDRSSSDVIKRVSGASIQDNKFAIIRGLGDRYNSAFLNGSPLPSSESDRKAFSFDIFPSALLDNIIILKTATPDVPADFAGGIININTRSIPEENMQAISIGVGYNTLTTFKPFYTYKGGKYDFLGIDDGTRKLQDGLPSTEVFRSAQPLDKALYAKTSRNDWALTQLKSVMPAFNFQYSLANVGKIKGRDFGSFVALTYNNNYSNRQSIRMDFDEPIAGQKPPALFELKDKQYENAILGGLIWNLSYKLNDNSKFSFKNLYSINSADRVVLREGIRYADGIQEKSSARQFTQNNLYSGQFSGEHLLPKSIKFNWIAGYSNIERNIPNLRRMLYAKEYTPGVDNSSVPFQAAIPSSGTSPSAGGNVFYSNNKEQISSLNYDLTVPFEFSNVKSTIKLGAYHQFRNRDFSSRQFGFSKYSSGSKVGFNNSLLLLSEDLIFSSANMGIIQPYQPAANGNAAVKGIGGFKLEEVTKLNDAYNATSFLNAAYAMIDNKFSSKIRLIWGARMEAYNQTLKSYEDDGKEVFVDSTVVDVLPSGNFIYSATEKANFRLSYAQTLSRPEFRELAPFGFFDFTSFFTVRGNPQLARALVHNYDFRYEWFPEGGQMFSVSVFYKRFINAIEQVNRAEVSRELYYKNVPLVNNYGAEFEFRLNLNSLIKESSSNLVNNLSVFSNVAIIKSVVDVSQIPGAIASTRPLQGQSPYVLNGGLLYNDIDKKFSVNLAVNKVGRRIFIVGNTQEPDIYENPVTNLDFQVSKTVFENLNMKLNISNLLAQDNVFYQDINNNGKLDKSFDNLMVQTNNARTISFSLSYQF